MRSVLDQDHGDWELVISDNCSHEDVEGYVRSLGEERIVYSRSEQPLAVTDNWNRALALCSGEYVVMLGDDDALLGGYMRRMAELIERFSEPDVVYTKALLFTYPGVDPERPDGFLMDHGCAEFFAGASDAFVLDRGRALGVVRDTMSFRMRFDFNAQFALVSRRLIDSLAEFGAFYQSDFPDYYSMNAAFLRAQRIVIDPAPRVVIGVTPKSYGYYHLNDREDQGRDLLGAAGPSAATGTNINVGWLSAAEALERGPAGAEGMRVDHRRYRLVQAAYVYRRHRSGAGRDEELTRLERELPPLERVAYRVASRALALVHRALPLRARLRLIGLAHRLLGQIPAVDPSLHERSYRDILEVCAARPPPSRAAARPAVGEQRGELLRERAQQQ